jgi:hypothetical protein
MKCELHHMFGWRMAASYIIVEKQEGFVQQRFPNLPSPKANPGECEGRGKSFGIIMTIFPK